MRRRFPGRLPGVAAGAGVLVLMLGSAAVAGTPAAWRVVPTPNPVNIHGKHATSDVQFYAALADGPDDAWGVGLSEGKNAYDLPMAEHWDGSRWAGVPVPAPAHRQGSPTMALRLGATSCRPSQRAGPPCCRA